jgi:hypothetical protein
MMIALSPESETSMKMTWMSAAAAGQSFVRVLFLMGLKATDRSMAVLA